MKLQDSGARREFETGAVRDIAEGKGRCDLLPLDVVGKLIRFNELPVDPILMAIHGYIWEGDKDRLENALILFVKKKEWNMPTAMLEAAKQYEDGAAKYGERNWQKGIPLHCYIDSAVRHYLKWRRGDTDEPHDRAFVWNILGAMWTHKNKPEMIDLPFTEKERKVQ